MSPRTVWRSALVAALMVVAGCAPPWAVDPERDAHYEEHLERWRALEHWSVSGRASVQGGGESVSLSLRWDERPDGYRLELSGPFGTGTVRLDGSPDGVVIDDGRGPPQHAETPEQLVEAYTGHELPVSALRDWLVGRPAADLPLDDRRLDRHGRPASYHQDGWTVEYRGWTEAEDGLLLPSRVDVRRTHQQLRVALSGWMLHEE